jgi:hypothetical protein
VRRDEEVIAAYEREWAEVVGDAVEVEEPTRRGGGRGFWMVVGALGLASVLLVTQIFANRSLKETIAHAQDSLRLAEAEANEMLRDTGSYASAGPEALSNGESALTYRNADDPSTGLDDVSVWASPTLWAAAVRARGNACFYIRLEAGGETGYGAGDDCTGRAALGARDPRW